MDRYIATKKFGKLGIENSYQGLETETYFALKAGKIVEIKNAPARLIKGGFIEIVKTGKGS